MKQKKKSTSNMNEINKIRVYSKKITKSFNT